MVLRTLYYNNIYFQLQYEFTLLANYNQDNTQGNGIVGLGSFGHGNCIVERI